ncbi:MAG: LarC family nickel insertion protein [Candidatus Gastranaerophilaceae bacterium]
MNLYFECKSGISGDMSVGELLDLGADKDKLDKALSSMNLDNEFKYIISKIPVNSIMTTDFNVILPQHNCTTEKNHHGHEYEEHNCHEEKDEHHHHTHEHRNLDDVNKIIEKVDASERAKELAKRIFEIVAEAESKVHGKDIKDVHFHEVGAIDSIVDIVSFAVLFDDLNPEKTYFSTLSEGQGSVMCQHGILPVPVPAVCEIAAKYALPVKITDNDGEMITPTGAAIVAALYTGETLPERIIIEKTGYGRGKRPYKTPILRVMIIK